MRGGRAKEKEKMMIDDSRAGTEMNDWEEKIPDSYRLIKKEKKEHVFLLFFSSWDEKERC